MKFKAEYLRLYAVTDRSWLGEQSLEVQVETSLKHGVTMVQLREKDVAEEVFVERALSIKEITQKYGVPLLINDNVSVAIKSGADGVHLGQGDMDAKEARKLLGNEKIIGVTAKTPEQARKALQDGADYIGTGAVFGTSTKQDAVAITIEQLKQVCESVSIPVVGIGGVTEENILKMKGSGVAGAAVVSAIFAQAEIGEATARLRHLADKL